MKIDKNTAVTLQYKVTDLQGKMIEDGKEPSVYLHGGYGNTLQKIEEALDGQLAATRSRWSLNPRTPLACATTACCAACQKSSSRQA